MVVLRRVLAPLFLAATACGGTIDGSADSGSNGKDAAVCTISASSYTKTCNVAADCAKIFTGNTCGPTVCLCPSDAIAQSSYAQYQSDLAALHPKSACNCPPSPGPDCCAGTCSVEPCDAGH